MSCKEDNDELSISNMGPEDFEEFFMSMPSPIKKSNQPACFYISEKPNTKVLKFPQPPPSYNIGKAAKNVCRKAIEFNSNYEYRNMNVVPSAPPRDLSISKSSKASRSCLVVSTTEKSKKKTIIDPIFYDNMFAKADFSYMFVNKSLGSVRHCICNLPVNYYNFNLNHNNFESNSIIILFDCHFILNKNLNKKLKIKSGYGYASLFGNDHYEFDYVYNKFIFTRHIRFKIEMVVECKEGHEPMTQLHFIFKHGSKKKFNKVCDKICAQLELSLMAANNQD